MIRLLIAVVLFFPFILYAPFSHAQVHDSTYAERLGYPRGSRVLILHVDDAGMSYESNEGAIAALSRGVANSVSVMMPCPWVPGFVEWLKENPGTDAGLHLTLTAEWKAYRWVPLSGRKAVPGLVDTTGCLWSVAAQVAQHASPDEVELEMTAQLERARTMGFEPTHLDTHMGTVYTTPEFLARYMRLGMKNHIPVMLPGGADKLIQEQMQMPDQFIAQMRALGKTLWEAGLPVLDDLHSGSYVWEVPDSVAGDDKKLQRYRSSKYIDALKSLQPGVTMMIMHCTAATPAFSTISDSGPLRRGDMLAMLDPAFKAALKDQHIILTTWRELMQRRMKISPFVKSVIPGQAQPNAAASYQQLHYKAIVVDTHNDVLSAATLKGLDIGTDLTGKTHSDLARFRKGGVDVQVFSIFCDDHYGTGSAYREASREIDSLYAIAGRNTGSMRIVTDVKGLEQVVKQHKLAAMLGVEGGHMIEDRIDYLDSLYRRGVRYMTLTWNNSTSWATSARDESSKAFTVTPYGLTDRGKAIVRRMNELGMLVDLSHVGEQTFRDAIHIVNKPVICSHSSVYALCPVFRNLKDDQIKAIGANGGVIQVNFYSGFLDSTYLHRFDTFMQQHRPEADSLTAAKMPEYEVYDYLFRKHTREMDSLRAPLSLLIDHIDYIVRLIGTDHVGLGSDFDGIESPPRQLNDVSTYPLITKELLKRGYKPADITKILGGNFIRVLKANELQ